MARNDRGNRKGVSLAKGPIALLGMAMLAWGIISLVLGGNSFTASPVDGTVSGERFLGLEGNGWTNLLWIAAGGLLLFGSPLHWGAKTMGIVVGLALGAASVISLVDGDDVFGIFAANGPTKLAWGVASIALLVLSMLPRVGGGKKDDSAGRVADRDRGRERMVTTPPTRVERERVVEREPGGRDRDIVADPDAGHGERITGGRTRGSSEQGAVSESRFERERVKGSGEGRDRPGPGR
jgi:hypothetical protein